jgi:hypothetical protein
MIDTVGIQLFFFSALNIDIFPKTVAYSTYETIQINCTLNPKRYANWTFSWKHYWNGVFVRTLEYTITDSIAVLDLPFCDYADNGEYTCTLHGKITTPSEQFQNLMENSKK